jgi:hypothetical protein
MTKDKADDAEKLITFVVAAVFAHALIARSAYDPERAFTEAEMFIAEAKRRGIDLTALR